MGREIVRHYAHLSERIQGLASGARLSIDSVMELFVRAARDELAGDPLFAAGLPLARSTEAGDTKLARTLAVALKSTSLRIQTPQFEGSSSSFSRSRLLALSPM